MDSQPQNTKVPAIALFLKPSPFVDAFIEDEISAEKLQWSEEMNLMVDQDGNPAWEAVTKRPPTTCTTPGKTRPAGYSRTGKWLPSKWIPSKTDKRVGK